MNLVFLSALLAILPVQQDITISSDSFEFRELIRVPYYAAFRCICGDVDHDGFQEFYTRALWSPYDAYILEFTPDMNYDTIRIPESRLATFWLIGDLDRDGKTDLCGEGSYTLDIYESPDSASLPLQRVSEIQRGGTIPFPITADLDRDGAQEILLKDHAVPSSIAVYECVADDIYAFRTALPDTTPLRQTAGFGCSPDIDRDGFDEIFRVAGSWVRVYEAVGDDTFAIKAIYQLPGSSGVWYATITGGPDIDRDGRNEAIIYTADYYYQGLLAVFESSENDSFEIVWVTQFPAGYLTLPTLATGDVDGDGVPEIAVSDGARIHLFRCTGSDQYEQFWQVYTGWSQVGLYDLNNDGKAEVIAYCDDDSTHIYEYFSLGITERQPAELQRISVYPSVVRQGEMVKISGLSDGAVSVVDASGRVIAKLEENVWRTGSMSPRTYFVRIQLGNQSITHKVLVLK